MSLYMSIGDVIEKLKAATRCHPNFVQTLIGEAIEMLEDHKSDKLIEAIKDCEKRHFRTVDDTGANFNAQIVLNTFREHAGLPSIFDTDLPKYDRDLKRYVTPEGSKLLSASTNSGELG